MSQSDLAQLADLPYPRLQRLLRPGSNPALEDAFRITQVLDVPLGRLFWLENGERDSP